LPGHLGGDQGGDVRGRRRVDPQTQRLAGDGWRGMATVGDETPSRRTPVPEAGAWSAPPDRLIRTARYQLPALGGRSSGHTHHSPAVATLNLESQRRQDPSGR
jgi:hypothetical protein